MESLPKPITETPEGKRIAEEQKNLKFFPKLRFLIISEINYRKVLRMMKKEYKRLQKERDYGDT